jgi:hypothetical protein
MKEDEMPAKKKAKKTKQPTDAQKLLEAYAQKLLEAYTENEQLRSQIDGMRRALRDENDRTQQARLERDGLLMLIALASNGGGIAQVKDNTPRVQTPIEK